MAFYEAASTNPEVAIGLLVELMSRDVVVHESPLVPWGGEYHGVQEFLGALAQISTYVEASTWEVVDIVAEADSVVSRCRVSYRPTSDSEPVRVMLCEWFCFRDGKIVEVWPMFFDVPPS